ncbi:hypothetical protein ACFSF0_17320, partial [Ottowia flava]
WFGLRTPSCFTSGEQPLGKRQLGIGTPLTIQGPGVTITAGYQSRVLTVATGTAVRLEGLTITGGAVTGNGGGDGQSGEFASGAGIFNAGQLTLKDVTVTANAAGGGGASASRPLKYRR